MGNPAPPVTAREIEIVAEWVPRFRAAGMDQPISASGVALGLPAIGARDRLRLVLAEMESRGLLERVDQQFDHIVGEARYRELEALSSVLSGGGDSQ